MVALSERHAGVVEDLLTERFGVAWKETRAIPEDGEAEAPVVGGPARPLAPPELSARAGARLWSGVGPRHRERHLLGRVDARVDSSDQAGEVVVGGGAQGQARCDKTKVEQGPEAQRRPAVHTAMLSGRRSRYQPTSPIELWRPTGLREPWPAPWKRPGETSVPREVATTLCWVGRQCGGSYAARRDIATSAPLGVRTQPAKPTHDPTRCPAWAAYGPGPVVHSGRRSLRASPPPLNPTGPKMASNGAPPMLCAGALRATPVPPSTTTAGAATTTVPLASGHGQTATQPGTRALALHLCTRWVRQGGAGGSERQMMGLAKMAPDGWRYYAEEVGLGREDYFAGHGEEPGRWIGRGAEALGLMGEVTPEQLSGLFGEGCHPGTGTALGRPFLSEIGGKGARDGGKRGQGGAEQVAGYALSFSPPKSVSLLWALAEEAVSTEVRRAHDAAVAAALEFLQDHAAFTRRGHAGAIQADTDGFVAAAFTHRTSRARDPQLHTHVLVSAKVRASTDGAWLSLDGRELFEVQKAAGLLYKAGLRAELSARLGVGWSLIDANGGAEIDGVPAALVGHFSTRRAQVEARAAQLMSEKEAALSRSLNAGEQAAAYQLAAYQSRAAKAKRAETTAELKTRWRREAAQAGHGPDDWVGAVLGAGQLAGRQQSDRPRTPRKSVEASAGEALEAMERAHSTWGRADLVEALAVRIGPEAVPTAERVRDLIDRAAGELLAHGDIVPLGPQPITTAPAPKNSAGGTGWSRRSATARRGTRQGAPGRPSGPYWRPSRQGGAQGWPWSPMTRSKSRSKSRGWVTTRPRRSAGSASAVSGWRSWSAPLGPARRGG